MSTTKKIIKGIKEMQKCLWKNGKDAQAQDMQKILNMLYQKQPLDKETKDSCISTN